MNQSTFLMEINLFERGYDSVVGVDEAGRGPLAGPVVACAVAIRDFRSVIMNYQANATDDTTSSKSWDLIGDSKTLSEKQREKACDFIHEHFNVGIGVCDHETIDRINILEATFLAMRKALTSLKMQSAHHAVARQIILVDGNATIPNVSTEQMAVVNGDGRVKSIAAASIVAKVTRDRIMKKIGEDYPHYGFERHKGYGTAHHLAALSLHGPCPIHRKSFAPVSCLARKEK